MGLGSVLGVVGSGVDLVAYCGVGVRVAPLHPMMGPNLPFYVVLFSLPFIGIAVNFCLFRFLHPRRALGWMVPVAFGFMFLFGLFPMPFRGLSMLGFGSVVCGLYPGVLLYQLLELRRRSRMSSDELEVFLAELEVREVEAQEREDKISAIYVSFLCLVLFCMVGFFAVGIPAMHWKGYDPSPMIFPVVVVTITGVAVSVLVKRVLGWKVSGWVYGVLLVVSVLGVLWVWGYPVVLLVAPWWVAYGIGSDWVALVEETAHSTLKSLRLYTQK